MKAVFHPAASDETVETTAYYEGEIQGLGDGFITEVEKVIGVLSDQPEIGQKVGGEFRRIILARFPYSLIYGIESDRIWVVAVAHHRRRPGYWQGRNDR